MANAPAARQPGAGANGLAPTHMPAAERLAEVAEILALGIFRLRLRSETPTREHAPTGESLLHFMAGESGGVTRRENAGTRS